MNGDILNFLFQNLSIQSDDANLTLFIPRLGLRYLAVTFAASFESTIIGKNKKSKKFLY